MWVNHVPVPNFEVANMSRDMKFQTTLRKIHVEALKAH